MNLCHDCGMDPCACDLHCDFCGFLYQEDACQPNNRPKEPTPMTARPKKPKPTNPTKTAKETPMKDQHADPAEAQYAEALAAITDTGAPKWLNSLDAEAWQTAALVIEQWAPNGELSHSITLQELVEEQRRLMPTLPAVKVAARTRKNLAQLAYDSDLSMGRVQLPQTGNVGTDPVLAFVALPETTRAFQSGYTVAVIVLWPTDTYTYEDTGEVVYGLYKSTPSGVARYYKDADNAEYDRQALADACRTMRRLASNPDTLDEDEPTELARAVKRSIL